MEIAKKYSSFILILIIILGGIGLAKIVSLNNDSNETAENIEVVQEEKIPEEVDLPSINEPEEQKQAEQIAATEQEDKVAETFKISNVPFVVQAPFANWDELHEDACEEAAILTVHYFFNGIDDASLEDQDNEIKGLVDLENQSLGKWKDTTADETGRIAKEKWGYNYLVKDISSIDDIKAEIAKGNPVILPANGQKLKNPYFKQPGPVYHMVVAVGYDNNNIITNDPGTKRGKDFFYTNDVILDAIGDWDGEAGNGKKVMLVLSK